MFLSYLCTTLLLLSGLLLIFVILLQRGRGGGLAGAFGGAGGESAFGTKAGDVFTKITIVMTVFWVVLAGVTGFAMRHDAEKSAVGQSAPENPVIGQDPDGKSGKTPVLGGTTPKPKKSDSVKTEPVKSTKTPAEKTTEKTSAKTPEKTPAKTAVKTSGS